MVKAMEESYPGLQITDLSDAVKNKSAEEVTKMFVDSTSFILRAAIGKADGKKVAADKIRVPLWNSSKLAVK